MSSASSSARVPNESSPLLYHDDGRTPVSVQFGDGEVDCTTTSSSHQDESLHGRAAFSVRQLSDYVGRFIAHHTGSIGMTGSMSIAVNSLTGPAMLGLPALFARSGIIPTCATVVFVAFLCSFSSLHMANTISKVTGNANFKKNVEYSDAFDYYWGRQWFNITQAIFFGCITCLNISSIVDTAQVVDTFLGNWWPGGGTAAVCIGGDDTDTVWSIQWWESNACTLEERSDGSCVPFANTSGTVFTIGMLVVTVSFLPLALLPLKENASYQVVAFLILLVTSVQFVFAFLAVGLDFSKASLWGTNWEDLFGVVLFNFALVIAIPAWLYERDPDVDVPVVVHGSCAMSAGLYIVIGILGHLAMPHVSDNMIQSMMSGTWGVPMQLGASIFAFAIVGFGIPLFSVLTRLNLVGSGMCSVNMANLLAVYFPFAVSWFLYDSSAVTKLLSWGGMIFTSLIAFIFPIALAIHVNKHNAARGSVNVYFGFFTERMSELISLRILLACTCTAVFAAVIGNFV